MTPKSVVLNLRSVDNSYVGVFELDGVVILRKQVLDSSLIRFNEGDISGIMISIVDGRSRSIVIGSISQDGKAQTVKILEQDR